MRHALIGALLLGFAAAALAQVEVKAPWVRGTVQGQSSSGAFMELTSAESAVLVGVESPIAGLVEGCTR